MDQITPDELKRLFPKATVSTLLRNQTGGAPESAERKPDTGDEPVAAPARARPDPVFRFVRVTSYRRVLLDPRNLYDKYFIDALVYAGVLFDDSEAWSKVEVEQFQVNKECDECTIIEIDPYP